MYARMYIQYADGEGDMNCDMRRQIVSVHGNTRRLEIHSDLPDACKPL